MDEQSAWSEIPTSVLNSKEHQALALRMARESLVLSQNKNNILPLNTHLKVAVMDLMPNDSVMQWGNYNGTSGTYGYLIGSCPCQTTGRTNHIRTGL